jgi:hypothetical protein
MARAIGPANAARLNARWRDLAAARTAYQAALGIAARLAAADPANTRWQRDLAIRRQRLEGLGTA